MSRNGNEMRTVLPVHTFPIDQPDIRLVDQCRRLQRVSRLLLPHVVRRQAVKLLIHKGCQLLQRFLVSVGPRAQAQATLQVPSSDAARISVGDPVELTVTGTSDTSTGRVTAVVSSVDPATQSATVVVSGVPQDAVAGNAIGARITVAHVRGMLVPQSAIVQDPQSGDSVIFVQAKQKDGSLKFEQRTVVVAHEDGTTAQVSGAVRAGDRIAAQGAFELLAPAGGGGD